MGEASGAGVSSLKTRMDNREQSVEKLFGAALDLALENRIGLQGGLLTKAGRLLWKLDE